MPSAGDAVEGEGRAVNESIGEHRIAEPGNSGSQRSAGYTRPGRLTRRRWALYGVAGFVALIPALWQWPAAYPWDHGSPCVTATAAAQTARAEGIAEPFVTPTAPGACVALSTLAARRNATSFP
jgi:hypothetical protein